MIFGIGTDIVEIARIDAALSKSDAFAARILTPTEMEEMQNTRQPARYLAKKFASKEALVKAMGTGIGNGISWQMMQVEHEKSGKPKFRVFDAVDSFFKSHGIENVYVSISDEQHYATATVVLER